MLLFPFTSDPTWQKIAGAVSTVTDRLSGGMPWWESKDGWLFFATVLLHARSVRYSLKNLHIRSRFSVALVLLSGAEWYSFVP